MPANPQSPITRSGTQQTSPSVNNSFSNQVNAVSIEDKFPKGPNYFPGWTVQVLQDIGAPLTSENVAWLSEWHAHDISGNSPPASYNPLDVTGAAGNGYNTYGTGSINSAGVQAYGSANAGAQANAEFLKMNNYNAILAGLMSGAAGHYEVTHPEVGHELSIWSNGGYNSIASTNFMAGIPNGFVKSDIQGAYSGVTSAVGSVTSAIHTTSGFIEKITNPLFWLRIAEIIGGVILVGMGLYLVAKDMGINAPKPPSFIGGATDQADDLSDAFEAGQAQGMRAQARRAGRNSVADASNATEPARETSLRRERIQRQAASIPEDDIPF